MTPNELRLIAGKFPLSNATLRRNQAGGDRAGASNVIQKLQASHPGQEHGKDADADRTSRKQVDGTGYRKYRVAVVFRLSDRRRRDPTGMFETVADVLIRAVGRFMQSASDGVVGGGIRTKRKRGLRVED